MIKKIALISACLWLAAFPALAGIEYYEDPVYKSLNAEDHHPMEDMLLMAEEGDARAQFILGDLYAKGKGGFERSSKKARHWFGESAKNGYSYSFIRLAAMAKHEKKPVEAYQWYTLALKYSSGKERAWASEARTQLEKEAKLIPEELKKARDQAQDWDTQKAQEIKEAKAAANAAKKAEAEKTAEEGRKQDEQN
jgi:TPR repeat protein